MALGHGLLAQASCPGFVPRQGALTRQSQRFSHRGFSTACHRRRCRDGRPAFPFRPPEPHSSAPASRFSVIPTTSPQIRQPESVQAPQRGISLPAASGLQARAPRRLSQAQVWLATLMPLIPIDRGLIPLIAISPCPIPKPLPGKQAWSGQSAAAGKPARLCHSVPAPVSAVQPSLLQQTRRPQPVSPASCSGSASVPFSDPEA